MLLNPMFGIIEGWHRLFMKGIFDWQLFSVSFFEGIVIFFIGFFIFKRLEPKFAEVL
jgi:lipopolysaccharide transport system permease protein